MNSAISLDLIQELQYRRWARRNYVPVNERSPEWHPVILDEMALRDCEQQDCAAVLPTFVPLRESRQLRIDGPHPLGARRGGATATAPEPAEFFYS